MSEPIRYTDPASPSDSEPAILPFPRANRIKVHVRWMVRRDIGEVAAIEQDCFEFPWDEEAFMQCLRQRNCIGMVAEYEGSVVGFMIYEVTKSRIRLLNVATAVAFRRRGVASQMIAKLIGKLTSQRRSRITLEVRETNLAAQLFFRQLGFRATEVLKEYYKEMHEDAYLMQFRSSDLAPAPSLARTA